MTKPKLEREKTMKASIYETITNQIVAAIEEGTGLYKMPWHRARADITNPVNVTSGRSYRVSGVLSPRWGCSSTA